VGFISRSELPRVYLWYRCSALVTQAKAELELLQFPWPRQLARACRVMYRMQKAVIVLERRVAVGPSTLLYSVDGSNEM